MSFISVYQQALAHEGYHRDTAQAKVVEQLDRLYRDLLDVKTFTGKHPNLISRMLSGRRNKRVLHGCYVWGGVGRGKTWLMDLFFDALPIASKSRFHFHEFMQQVHNRLNGLNGRQDPLRMVAKEIAQSTRLICLDEFHVSDITDAMLLHGLLEALSCHGVVLLMTSNVSPDELYKNGLQRSRFEPAIDLIKQQNCIIYVEGESDYRLGNASHSVTYHSPLSQDTDTVLENQFQELAEGAITSNQSIIVHDRSIQTRMHASNIVWFEFEDICGGPRAAIDYLYLADNYKYLIVSNIYKMQESDDDIAKRFIHLVDTCYDRDIGFIASATAWPRDLYVGRRFQQEFQRTISRLEELRSKALPVNHAQRFSAVTSVQPG